MPARALVVAAAGALALVAVGAASASAGQVDAGPLSARIDRDPWRLAFTDRNGRTVLDETPGTALLPPDVDTLASYGDRSPAVSLDKRRDRRVLLAFPRGSSTARLDDGGLLRSRERPGEWSLEFRSTRTRRWTIEASLATLRRPFRPCALDVEGGRLAGWSFDRRTRVLRAILTTRRGRLLTRACR